MAPIDTKPPRMSACTRLVEKRRELACQESSDKPVLEKRSGDEKTNGESSLAKANSGIVIKITNTDNEDYYIEGGDEEGIDDYDDTQSLDKDDAEAIEEDEESDEEEQDEEYDESFDTETKNHNHSKKKTSNPEIRTIVERIQ